MTMQTPLIPEEVSAVTKGTRNSAQYHIERLGPASINLSHLKVPDTKQEQGIGTEFLDELQRQARLAGIDYVVVNIGGGSDSVEFFVNRGFSLVERGDDGHVTVEKELPP